MSGYGNPILQTGNPIRDALPLLLRAMDDRQSRAFHQRSLDRQDQQFAYRQAQDAREWDQNQTDAGAMSTALGGGVPALQGVSPNGISKIAEIQNRADLARSAKLDKTLQFLEPHVLNGSKMAQHNYDRAMSEYFGEDFTGSGEALRTGQFDKFIQQKQLEKQIALEMKMAEQEMMRQVNAPENLARVKLAGMPTAGLDGTMGPPDQMAEAIYNANPADARAWMDDKRAEKAAAAKASEKAAADKAKEMTPEQFDTAVRRYRVNNPTATQEEAEAYVGGSTGFGQGGKRTMTLDSNGSQTDPEKDPAVLNWKTRLENAQKNDDVAGAQQAINGLMQARAIARQRSGGAGASNRPAAGQQRQPSIPPEAIDAAWAELGADADPKAVLARARELAGGG